MTTNFRKQIKYLSSLFILLLLFTKVFAEGSHIEKAEQWKFAVISDTQSDNHDRNSKSCINDEVVYSIAEDIAKEKPDFVLVSGDLVNGWFKNNGIDYSVQYAEWKKAMDAVYRSGIKIYPVRGNHDSGPERVALPPLPSRLEPPLGAEEQLKKAFKNAFSESYIPQNGPVNEKGLTYSFSHKNAFIIGLDQYTDGQHKVNQKWLERQLAGNDKPHVFVLGHEPAFETVHKDNLSFYQNERDAFWDSIGKAGARIYFCGHDHMYNRALIPDSAGDPVRQIIAGTGGGGLRTWSGEYKDKRVKGEFHSSEYHGYILVIIAGPKITVEWKALIKPGADKIWKIQDVFTITE